MGGKRQLADLEKGEINTYAKLGFSQRDIARRLNRSKTVVQHYLKDRETYGKIFKGRKSKTIDSTMKRRIFRLARTRRKSCAELARVMNLQVSPRRIAQILSGSKNFKYCKRKHTPNIQKRHKAARILFAKTHHHGVVDWNRVVFSDEKKFNLDGPNGWQSY